MAKKPKPVEPKYMTPDNVKSVDQLKPNFNWDRPIPSPGRMAVDFEERVNFQRLHGYRLARARQALNQSQLGAVLLFDINNIRYLTSTSGTVVMPVRPSTALAPPRALSQASSSADRP